MRQQQQTEGVGCLEVFHETFYNFKWEDLIDSSEQEIELVVYYFDNWLKQNQDRLESFLRKPETKLKIILSNPDRNLETLKRLYKYNENTLRDKIQNTQKIAEDILNQAGATSSRLEIYLFPHPLNYSIQSFDRQKVVVSLFEMFRKNRVESPVFLLNLAKSEKTRNFITKEIEGLIQESKKL